jgi:hypothetical protein
LLHFVAKFDKFMQSNTKQIEAFCKGLQRLAAGLKRSCRNGGLTCGTDWRLSGSCVVDMCSTCPVNGAAIGGPIA